MATEEHGQFTRESAERIGDVVRYVERMQRNDLPTASRRGEQGDRLAMTEGTHAPDAEQAVNLCQPDWTETANTVNAVNDSGVTVPDNTRIYIRRIAGKWRIYWADVCSG